jgi:hypothetical protein
MLVYVGPNLVPNICRQGWSLLKEAPYRYAPSLACKYQTKVEVNGSSKYTLAYDDTPTIKAVKGFIMILMTKITLS